ncbi:MAG TPA: (2Fe-2S)-binding protein [bacterium]|nr:(2Fe-2S)-binding protein [bacterium]HOL48426.1 (2Fe-2S)-binding protein [bacterium]HPQ20042.1 (2Fe-2S)-binding protein [bacterium]
MSEQIYYDIECEINGEKIKKQVPSNITLLNFLREYLKLTGTKEGCGKGECGACTVIMNGKAVNSCLVPITQVNKAKILTIEGLSNDEQLHPIQEAYIKAGAVQCGFCTPGFIMSTKALLDEKPEPTREDIKKYLAGNLCRCTGYEKIFEAVELAAKSLKKK